MFRAYRRLGHLKPAAERCHVARMTGRKILDDLESQGFSLRPRLRSLAEEDLAGLQVKHLHGVALQLEKIPLLTPPAPRDCVFGEVDEHELSERKLPEPGPLDEVLGVDAAWHIRTLPVERSAASYLAEDVAYRRACLALCHQLMGVAEEVTGLPLRPEQRPQPGTTERSWESGWVWLLPVIAPLYKSLFGEPGLDPAKWRVEAGGAELGPKWKALRQGKGTILAEAPAQGVSRAQQGLTKLVSDGLEEMVLEARTLELRWQDLKTLSEVVRDRLSHIAGEGDVPGICPACPFPEKDEPAADGRRRRRG